MNRPEPDKILRINEVIDRVGLKKTALYALHKQGKLRKITLGCRAVGWLESEVNNFIQSQAEGRNQ